MLMAPPHARSAVPAPGSGLPSWAANATARTWVTVPMANTLADINPANSGTYNVGGYSGSTNWTLNNHTGLVTAWCGAAFDGTTSRMWLGCGGGHADYRGNEIYRCDFDSEAPAWTMLNAPSGSAGATVYFDDGLEATGLYTDSKPRAVHTNNKWLYVPGFGPMLIPHGAGSITPTNGGKRWPVLFDESSGAHSFGSEGTAFTITAVSGAGVDWDASRSEVWVALAGTSPVVRYKPATDTWTTVVASTAKYGQASICYLPDDDCLLMGESDFSQTVGRWRVVDCATGTVYAPTFTSNGQVADRQGSARLHWIASLGAAVCWDNAASTTLITVLTKPANPRTGTWTVDTLSVDPSNAVTPSAATANGTYGRFAYSSQLGGFLLFNSTSGSTYFFKL